MSLRISRVVSGAGTSDGSSIESSGDTIIEDSECTCPVRGRAIRSVFWLTIHRTTRSVGLTAEVPGNVLGENALGGGLDIATAAATGNVLVGNLIGTDSAGDNLANAAGVIIASPSNTIGGTTAAAANVFGYNTEEGVSIPFDTSTNNLVEGNFIGTNASGANLNDVVGVVVSGTNNTIGGNTASSANVIGFNSTAGVSITGASATGNLVAANFIGTNPTNPVSKQGNAVGVAITSASNNTIGGTATGLANIIGFNTATGATGAGVSISGASSTGNQIVGNDIGTNAAGNLMPNDAGVVISGASSNTIGGTVSGAGNTIGFNTGAGVNVVSGTGDAIQQDLIFSNGSGIILGSGANNNQPAPVITGVTSVNGSTTITVSLAGSGFVAGSTYSLDFFASALGDSPSQVQAHIFLETATVTAGASPITLPSFSAALAPGQTVTATATVVALRHLRVSWSVIPPSSPWRSRWPTHSR